MLDFLEASLALIDRFVQDPLTLQQVRVPDSVGVVRASGTSARQHTARCWLAIAHNPRTFQMPGSAVPSGFRVGKTASELDS